MLFKELGLKVGLGRGKVGNGIPDGGNRMSKGGRACGRG